MRKLPGAAAARAQTQAINSLRESKQDWRCLQAAEHRLGAETHRDKQRVCPEHKEKRARWAEAAREAGSWELGAALPPGPEHGDHDIHLDKFCMYLKVLGKTVI